MLTNKISTNESQIEEFLSRGVQDILPGKEELRKKLLSGQKLKIYMGIDPTSPVVHIGHISTFNKLRQLQEMGHEIVVLVGDFTAIAGDPDKTEARQILTDEDILKNMETYKEQLSRIIKFDGENPASFRRNSEWLSKLTFKDVINLSSHFTVQQMLERDNFQKRMSSQTPIRLHEFLYPLMQGYDSVALEVDLELGGNDQLFNMMFGRTLMKDLKGKEKFVMTGKLLVDGDGKKIGKTTGNAWSFALEPSDIYGKIMSGPDATTIQCFEQLTNLSMDEIRSKEEELKNGRNPIELKKELAYKIIAQYFSIDDAEKAQEYFVKTFQNKDVSEVKEITLSKKPLNIVDLIIELGLTSSKTQVKTLIDQGAIEINEQKISSSNHSLDNEFVLKVGKKNFMKIKFNE